MDDYYCKICKAHMNSQDMWESHISGKRHLKNVKKEREAPHPPRQEKDNEVLRSCTLVEAAGSSHRRKERSRSPSTEKLIYQSSSNRKKVCTSPEDGKWRHDRFYLLHEESPPRRYPHSNDSGLEDFAQNLTMSNKIELLKKISSGIVIVSENEVKQVKSIVTSLFQEYLLMRARELTHAVPPDKTRRHHH